MCIPHVERKPMVTHITDNNCMVKEDEEKGNGFVEKRGRGSDDERTLRKKKKRKRDMKKRNFVVRSFFNGSWNVLLIRPLLFDDNSGVFVSAIVVGFRSIIRSRGEGELARSSCAERICDGLEGFTVKF